MSSNEWYETPSRTFKIGSGKGLVPSGDKYLSETARCSLTSYGETSRDLAIHWPVVNWSPGQVCNIPESSRRCLLAVFILTCNTPGSINMLPYSYSALYSTRTTQTETVQRLMLSGICTPIRSLNSTSLKFHKYIMTWSKWQNVFQFHLIYNLMWAMETWQKFTESVD